VPARCRSVPPRTGSRPGAIACRTPLDSVRSAADRARGYRRFAVYLGDQADLPVSTHSSGRPSLRSVPRGKDQTSLAQAVSDCLLCSRSSPVARSVRPVPATPLSLEPPSRFRPSLRLEYLSLRLAFSEIVEGQGRRPWWVSRPTASSASLRPAVTPTTPVGFSLGSSVELPSGSVQAEPSV
jgi:hypothetical protein